jgi:GT2 family glycosyltransferase
MSCVPSVFIIILNFNGGTDLEACLESVCQLDYQNCEVVLVDNGSTDGSYEKAKDNFPGFFFLNNNRNLGFSAGNNVGIRFSLKKGAKYILLLNNDTLVSCDFLTKLVSSFSGQPQAGIASPVIFDRAERLWFSGGKIDWLRMRTKHLIKEKSLKSYESEFITGCAMLIKKEVFKKIGLLDERFFLYYEDADFSLRSKRAGFRNIIVPTARIKHLEKSEKLRENKVYWLVLSGLIFFQKNSPLLWRVWQRLFVAIRKAKNRLDIKNRPDKINQAVARAYADFGKYEKR